MADEINEETVQIDDGTNSYDIGLDHDWDSSTQKEPQYSLVVETTPGSVATLNSATIQDSLSINVSPSRTQAISNGYSPTLSAGLTVTSPTSTSLATCPFPMVISGDGVVISTAVAPSISNSHTPSAYADSFLSVPETTSVLTSLPVSLDSVINSPYIGDVLIPTIQSFNVSSSKETEELDLVDKDRNFVMEGSEPADDIEIEFALIDRLHPNRLTPEEQRGELKTLMGRDVEKNSIDYRWLNGHISVQDVDLSESSDLKTYREGTISGKYYPWPKHFDNTSVEYNK